MTAGFAITMLVAGGLYAGGVLSIGWERSGAWRVASSLDFRRDFAHTIRRADMLQPALLIVTALSAVGFAFETPGLPRVLAATAAVGLAAVLVGSAATLVRIQRRIVSQQPELATAEVERLKEIWIAGHLARTAAVVACFALLVVAAVV